MSNRWVPSPLRITVTAVFTALVAAATIMLSVYVPATRGYFNVGEIMVYTTALLFGPYVGAFAGGVGSMLADIFLGYSIYAPATLIIKAAEGAVVGYLGMMFIKLKASNRWRIYTSFIGLLLAAIIAYIGTTKYVGAMEASIGLPSMGYVTLQLYIPEFFWVAIAIVAGSVVTLMGILYEPQLGFLILSTLIGGIVMVLGYFLYQWFLFGAVAFAEVPINIGQVIIGVIVSTPLVRAIWARLPQLRH